MVCTYVPQSLFGNFWSFLNTISNSVNPKDAYDNLNNCSVPDFPLKGKKGREGGKGGGEKMRERE